MGLCVHSPRKSYSSITLSHVTMSHTRITSYCCVKDIKIIYLALLNLKIKKKVTLKSIRPKCTHLNDLLYTWTWHSEALNLLSNVELHNVKILLWPKYSLYYSAALNVRNSKFTNMSRFLHLGQLSCCSIYKLLFSISPFAWIYISNYL